MLIADLTAAQIEGVPRPAQLDQESLSSVLKAMLQRVYRQMKGTRHTEGRQG